MNHAIQPAKAPPGSTPLLDPRREAFAIAYSETGNALGSAARCGLAKHASTGSRLLQDQEVAARIRWLNEQQFRAAGITAERVKQELARVAFASAADLVDADGNLIGIHDLPDDAAATITGIDVEVQEKIVKDEDGNPTVERIVVKKIRRADKMAALGLLARHFKIVGAEDDGVNALATALADRLNAASRRLNTPPPPVVDSSDVEDAVIIEPARTPDPPPPLPERQPLYPRGEYPTQESSDEQLW